MSNPDVVNVLMFVLGIVVGHYLTRIVFEVGGVRR